MSDAAATDRRPRRAAAWMPLLAAAALLLGGCASAPVAPPADPLPQADTRFAPVAAPPDADAVFALDAPMRAFLDAAVGRQPAARGRPSTLIDALGPGGALRLAYDGTRTRTAAQAFEARAGNCLSLVLMTAAFAKAMGLQVQYNEVLNEAQWARDGDLLFTSGHVNLTLGRPLRAQQAGHDPGAWLTVDFLPGEELQGQRRRPIAEPQVVAMFLNNRAAESLADGRIDEAYAWARAAVRQSPGFLAAWNTLAVVYLRRGLAADAEPLLQHVLAVAPEQPDALANLRATLKALGRDAEAQAVAQRLARLEPFPPLHFLDLGVAALQGGDPAAARGHLLREIRRGNCASQCHYWLAVALARLGERDAARRELQTALDNAASGRKRELYAQALATLRDTGAR